MFRLRLRPQSQVTVECLAFRPTRELGGEVWCGLGNGHIEVFDFPTRANICELQEHRQRVTAIVLAEGDVWAASFDGSISVFKGESKRLIKKLMAHENPVTSLAFVRKLRLGVLCVRACVCLCLSFFLCCTLTCLSVCLPLWRRTFAAGSGAPV